MSSTPHKSISYCRSNFLLALARNWREREQRLVAFVSSQRRSHHPKIRGLYRLPSEFSGNEGHLWANLMMPYCKKAADEMLLGLLCDVEELYLPAFEIPDDGKACALLGPEVRIDKCGYIELININGKFLYCEPIMKAYGTVKGRRILSLAAWKKRAIFQMRNAGPWP